MSELDPLDVELELLGIEHATKSAEAWERLRAWNADPRVQRIRDRLLGKSKGDENE